ncbi:glycosyltransferase family 2 protein [Natrinema marinum]|uniref:glycosyltransferase family 2 protein n=1 Tax=Natrinema marinum TaxID=2961598 RepID=UPI0020C8AFC0|nr:glycosyltransferase family 2 protein [Natrinema marinum]
MAGKGSRFRNVGVSIPKHEISVRGRPMFDWAMQSLKMFFDSEFIFVTQSEHAAASFLEEACDRLGISTFQEVSLDEYTNGQAATAMAADRLIGNSESVVIYNIDTYIEAGQISPSDISGDGFIPVFETPGERWSFVRKDEDGTVTRVSEKEKISDQATVGFYHFAEWGSFADAYEAAASSVKSKYGETYVAPLYNYLIEKGLEVTTHQIDSESVHVLGTPDDLRMFDPGFNPESTE